MSFKSILLSLLYTAVAIALFFAIEESYIEKIKDDYYISHTINWTLDFLKGLDSNNYVDWNSFKGQNLGIY